MKLSRPARLAATGAALLLGWAVLQLVVPRNTPLGIVCLGITLGGLNALLAVGIILVYRTNRIVNFAHGELGAFAGILAAQLIAAGWNYFAAVGAGLVSAAVASGLVELGIVRRFRNAPRLLLTVATIGVAQILVFVQLVIPRLFDKDVVSTSFRTPLSRYRFEISPVLFDGNHVAIVVVVAATMVGLGFFFRGRLGLGVRAAAENAERAALCGVPNVALSTLVWVIAGGLSAAAAILQSPVVGIQVGVLIGPGLLLRALAAAVIGRMESLSVTVAAALCLAVLEQAIFWAYGRSTVIDATLLVVILVALAFQRSRFARVDPADASTWQAIGEVRPVPRELRRLPEVRIGRVVLGALGALLVLGLPALFEPSRQSLAAVVVIFAVIGVSLVVLIGWAGQISLGQFALVGIGAAVAGSLTADRGLDFVVSVPAGGGAGLLAALVLGVPALRVRGFFLAVTTLAFAVTTSSYLLAQDWLVPGGVVVRPYLFGRFDLEDELTYYYVCVVVLALVVLAARGFRSSRIGRAVVAVRDNPRAAQSYGINATVARLTAFAVSGFVAGLAGALLVHQQHGLPSTQYAPQQSLAVFALAVVGGLGTLPGAVVGAVFLKGSQYLLQGPWQFFATGVGQLVLLLILPGGLGSLVFGVRDALLRVVARRRGIVVASILADRRVDEPEPDVDAVDERPLGMVASVAEAR